MGSVGAEPMAVCNQGPTYPPFCGVKMLPNGYQKAATTSNTLICMMI